MTDEVRPVYSKVAHQRPTVERLLCDADRTGRAAASGTSDPMVAHQEIALSEGLLFTKRHEEVREDPRMHEHNRLTTSKQLIRELNAIDSCAGHLARLSIELRRLRRS